MKYSVLFILIAFSVVFSQEVAISTAAGGQVSTDVASDGNKYFAIWEDTRAGTGNPNIFGRSINGDGSLPGFEVPIQSIPGYQRIPAVGFIDEVYIGAWMDQTSGYAVDGKSIDTSGTPTFIAFDIATASGMIQNINIRKNGSNALVVWEERVSGISNARACVVDESETATTPVDLSASTGNQKGPQSAPLGGGWVVVFEDSTSSGKGVYAVKITSAGALDGMPYLLASGNGESNPSIASKGDGFLVAYDRDGGATGRNIFGILLSSAGAVSGSAFPICNETGDQTRPAVVFDGVGYLVVWQDTRDIFADIYGQRISGTGTLIGTEIAVCDSAGSQQKPKLASNGSNILVAWEDTRGATSDIYGMILPQMAAADWPEVTVLEPLPLTMTACSRNPVKMLLSDDDGIDPYTASFSILADTVNYFSSSLAMVGDTLRFTPPWDFPSGDSIRACLLAIEDSLGNALPDPVCWTFFADLDAPVPSNERPRDGQIIDSLPANISINLTDSLSGVCAATISFVFDTDTFTAGSPEITFDGYTARLNFPPPTDTVGTHTVKIFAGDTPDYCDPNMLEYEWDFFVNAGGGPNASTMLPKNGDVTSNSIQDVTIKIKDDDGVDYSSIELSYDGTVYDWTSGHMTFEDTVLTFTPPSAASHEDDITVMLITALDSLGNNIETPLSFSFSVDIEAPLFLDKWPGDFDTLRLGTTDVKVLAQDTPAGIIGDNDHADYYIYDLSMALLESPGSGVTQRADTVVLQSGAFGGSLDDDIDVVICVRLFDNVDIGVSNSDSICWQVHIQHMGIDETEKPAMMGIQAYPNPFNASCRIHADEIVEIFDISGRKVWQSSKSSIAEGCLWKPKSDLPGGVYLAKTLNGKHTMTILFVK